MEIDFSHYNVGAAFATGLANTAPAVRTTTAEPLADPGTLAAFLAEYHVAPDALTRRKAPSSRDLAEVLDLRDEIKELLEGTENTTAEGATRLIEKSTGRLVLRRDDDGAWRWRLATARHARLAEELAALAGMGVLGALQALGHQRFRHCAAPTCHGVFVDVSKAGRRRYCTPERCGNRLNVAAHRARQRTSE